MNDQIIIQRRFTIERDGLAFSDAIVLPEDEYNALTPEQIEAIKEERFQNWKTIVTTPSEEVVE